MTWADASVPLGILAFFAWALWMRHRTSVRAMELGYKGKSGYKIEPHGKWPPPPPPRLNK